MTWIIGLGVTVLLALAACAFMLARRGLSIAAEYGVWWAASDRRKSAYGPARVGATILMFLVASAAAYFSGAFLEETFGASLVGAALRVGSLPAGLCAAILMDILVGAALVADSAASSLLSASVASTRAEKSARLDLTERLRLETLARKASELAALEDRKKLLRITSKRPSLWRPQDLLAEVPLSPGEVLVEEREVLRIYRRIRSLVGSSQDIPVDFLQGRAQSPHSIEPSAFDPNVLLPAFSKLRLKKGQCLDYVWRGNPHEGSPLLYCRAESDAPLKSVSEYAVQFADGADLNSLILAGTHTGAFSAPYLRGVDVDPSPLGFVELVIFLNEVSFFYWYSHAYYDRISVLATQEQRKACMDGFGGRDLDAASAEKVCEAFYGAKVRCDDRRATVELLTYQINAGFGLRTWRLEVPPRLLEETYVPVVVSEGEVAF